VLPEGASELEEKIREKVDEWEQQAEQEIEDLIDEITALILAEVEGFFQRLIDNTCGNVCGASALIVFGALLLWWRIGRIPIRSSAERPTNLWALWRRTWKVIVGLAGVVLARSFLTAAVVTFLPTYFYRQGETLLFANGALTVLEAAGSAGVLTSGTISDWLGRRVVLAAAIALSPLLMLLFLAVDGPLVFPVLALLGFVTLSTTPVLMAMMIESAGGDRAAANGTYMMVSFALRSAVIPLVGAVGDWIGLRDTYLLCACAAFVGLPFVLLFPRKR
jgi:FSR family fosmidomycin resistance protein-like MFS transporter